MVRGNDRNDDTAGEHGNGEQEFTAPSRVVRRRINICLVHLTRYTNRAETPRFHLSRRTGVSAVVNFNFSAVCGHSAN